MYNKTWIQGYENLYEIDTNGVIYRHTKSQVKSMVGNQNPKSGYLIVALSKDGKVKTYSVHRLVALAFIDNPENKPFIDHIDEDKTNNVVSNLRWCTAQENNRYYDTKDGRRYQKELAQNYKAKLREYEKRLIERVKEVTKLENQLKISQLKLQQVENKLQIQTENLEQQKQLHREYVRKTINELVNKPYEGYADTKGIKFESVEEMIKLTGKPITINGKIFNSCKAAAAFIVAEELLFNRVVNKETIRKELRKFQQGLRASWKIYGKYEIT